MLTMNLKKELSKSEPLLNIQYSITYTQHAFFLFLTFLNSFNFWSTFFSKILSKFFQPRIIVSIQDKTEKPFAE